MYTVTFSLTSLLSIDIECEKETRSHGGFMQLRLRKIGPEEGHGGC